MALSVKNKRSFAHLHHAEIMKLCMTDQKILNMAEKTPIPWPNPMRAIGAQNLLTMPGGVTFAGYLHKKGGSQFSLMKWPLRYIIIHKGCVYYFKTSTHATPQGAFSLKGYNRVMRAAEETTSSNVFPFKIVHFSKKHRTWYFSAASEDERRKWMRYLRKEIDHYNDKKDLHDPSDSDSDAESFYGPIERPLDIKDTPDDPNAEYVMQDEDHFDEDYLIPDGPAALPKVPAPSYPPPPVPVQELKPSIPSHPKGLPPPVPPPNKNLPALNQRTPSNHLPPPNPKPQLRMTVTSGVSPGCQKKTITSSASLATLPLSDRKLPPAGALKPPFTLPICQRVEKSLNLNSDKPSLPQQHHRNLHNVPPTPPKPNFKPAPPMLPKPPVPVKPKAPQLIQRSSPDGQSFRSSVEEKPVRRIAKVNDDDEDSDDGYENVQLPDSVFVDTTETGFVEILFKETSSSPADGLYCIRNSGTKTSQVLVVWDVSLNKARNYRIFNEGLDIFLEQDLTFTSLVALVEHYHTHPLPNHGSLCLQQPYGYTPPR